MLSKSVEASMEEGGPYLGLSGKDIGLSSPDLLADQLLQDGDPDPEKVKAAAPPLASAEKNPRTWTTFVGTKEAFDVTPRSEEHTSELQSHLNLVCRLLLEKKKFHTLP